MSSKRRPLPKSKKKIAMTKKPAPPGTAADPWQVTWAGKVDHLGRDTWLTLLVILLIGWSIFAWPRLTLPLSESRDVVAALDTDVLYNGDGLTPEQEQGVREAIGTRPITFAFIADDDPRTERDLCDGVSSRLPDVQFVTIRGGEFTYVCTGDGVPTSASGEMKGVAYELRVNRAIDLVQDAPVDQAQAVALVHDSMVRSGLLTSAEERSLRTPWGAVSGTVLTVAAVLAGVMVLLYGIRAAVLYVGVRRARQLRQEQLRDQLDDALAELALVVVNATPADPRTESSGDAATDYLELLERARTAEGGWAGLLAEVRAAVERSEREGSR